MCLNNFFANTCVNIFLEKMQKALDDVMVDAITDFYSRKGVKMGHLSKAEKISLLHTADPKEAEFLNRLIWESEDAIRTRFESKWSHLFHPPEKNFENSNRINIQSSLKDAEETTNPTSNLINLKKKILMKNRTKYNFHSQLTAPTRIDYYVRQILKGGDKKKIISNKVVSQTMKEMSEEEKNVILVRKTILKKSIETQNKVPILLAIKNNDWLALQKSEVKKFGTKDNLENFVEAWQKIQHGGVLHAEKSEIKVHTGISFNGNCFRYIPELKSSSLFVDLEKIHFHFHQNGRYYYEKHFGGAFDGKIYKDLTPAEQKQILNWRKEYLRKSVTKFKKKYDRNDNVRKIEESSQLRRDAVLASMRNFSKNFVIETIQNEDLDYWKEINSFYKMAKMAQKKPMSVIEKIALDEDFLPEFKWINMNEKERKLAFTAMSTKDKTLLQDTIKIKLQNLHQTLRLEYAEKFYIPFFILDWAVPTDLEPTLIKSEMKVFGWLKKSIKDRENEVKEREQAEINKILQRNRRKFFFPDALEPPRPIDLYKSELEKEGVFNSPASIEIKWKNLPDEQRSYYTKFLSKEISDHRKTVEMAAKRAIYEKAWFALKPEEIILYGTDEDLENHRKAWAEGERDLVEVIEKTDMKKFEWQLLSSENNERKLLMD